MSTGVTGALGLVMPQISDSQLSAYVTAGLIVWSALSAAGGVIWGWWKNRKKAQENHTDNVATAAATAKATMASNAPVSVPVEVSSAAVQASSADPIPVVVSAAALTAASPPVPLAVAA
jgi:hypothetical protein